MGTSQRNSRGFTLIAALLLTILLSGVAVGLLYMVSNEVRMGGNDLEGNLAYYGAEAGIENLTSQLSTLYQTSQSPDAASITALTNPSNYPTLISGSNISNMNYVETITWPSTQTDGTPCPNPPDPCGSWNIVGSGSNQGMVATLIPFTLQVTATRQAGSGQTAAYSTAAATGASVNLTRTVQVALLPAFEFGVFCDGDCDYFAGPDFNFGGRVHTNGNLFLAEGGKLTFTDKIAAVGQVVLDRLENGHPTSSGYGGSIYVPSAAGACPNAPLAGPATNCANLPAGSWTGGFPPTGSANSAWTGISKSTFNGFIENGLTGATKLQLPFVNSGDNVGAIDILRKPQASDSTLLSNSRLYNEAEIRILLADSLADLHPERGAGALDSNDVQIGVNTQGSTTAVGYTLTQGPYSGSSMYFGEAKKSTGSWLTTNPTGCASNTYWPLHGQVTQPTPCTGTWLRVEYLNNANQWVGVTQEWLGYGFGRGYNNPPTTPYQYSGMSACPMSGTPSGPCYNPISPAILILQQLQSGKAASAAVGATTTWINWLPINFYDSREGEPRDTRSGSATACGPNGVMNVVELDAGNLWLWLQGKAPYAGGSGKLVNATKENGYILYFSDHRGMQPDPNPVGNGLYNRMTGMSGLEDIVNSASSTGVPNGSLEPITYYNTPPNKYSPEDVNADGYLDNWGQKYLGAGFGISIATMNQPYYINGSTSGIASCSTTAMWNMVTGPRHALRLVDGGMDNSGNSYLPHPTPPATSGYGFTVASEEPVYVYGDYNTGPSDPFWPSENTTTTPHSAAAIIADAVTLLSNPPSSVTKPASNVGWTDYNSFVNPSSAASRPGNTSYYRMAIAAGKSIPFPQPSWGAPQDFGTDGGMHNFLRYLENRGANNAQVNYAGSMISMYYSQYATGNFKCCNSTYGAPYKRNYFFDTQFLNPENLPPGTPMFQDVVSLSYHQNFTQQ